VPIINLHPPPGGATQAPQPAQSSMNEEALPRYHATKDRLVEHDPASVVMP
jgi:hypothetical protein